MEKYDMKRIELEQEILNTWNIIDDIKLINNLLTESTDFKDIPAKSLDHIQNYLLGLQTIYHYKFEKMFNTFEEMLKEQREQVINTKIL